MDLNNLDSHYSALISTYLSGNASPAQIAELEEWVLADADNKQQFMAFKKAWVLVGMQEEKAEVNVEKLWQQTSKELFAEAKVVDLKKRTSLGTWTIRIAAGIIILLLGYFIFRPQSNSVKLFAATDEAKDIQLADGSEIVLNRQSRLEYIESKEGKREVKLEGDAFFEVAKDEAKPFVIQASGLEVEVLGTSFYVDARKEQAEIQVIVKSGRVAVRGGGSEKILEADQKAIFQKSNQQLQKEENDDPNFLALSNDTLIFDNTPFEEVVFVLERQFGVGISLVDEELKSCPILGTFVDKSLDTILNVIQTTHNIQISKSTDGDIAISGSCQG